MCGKSDVLDHLHQGLLLSSTNMDANHTAVVPDIGKMLSMIKCNSGVDDNQTS